MARKQASGPRKPATKIPSLQKKLRKQSTHSQNANTKASAKYSQSK